MRSLRRGRISKLVDLVRWLSLAGSCRKAARRDMQHAV